MKLRGARVLVTGATGGIGQAIAVAVATRGAEVILSGRRTDVLDPLADRLGGQAIAADLADRESIAALLDKAGKLDVIVANAALPAAGDLLDYSVAEIDRALEINLRSQIVLARLAVEQFVARDAREKGQLVFINSLSGKNASAHTSMYNATKFGLRGFAQALREELRPQGVGVSSVYPGFIRDAGMFADARVSLPPGVGTRTPQDVARAVVKAIEQNVGEIDVAPAPLRIGALIGGVAPRLTAAVQRLGGGDRVASQIAEGHRDHR
jgi:short-subunit dehydrogenase